MGQIFCKIDLWNRKQAKKMFVRIDQMLLSSCFLLGQSCPGGDPGLEWGELSKEVTDDGEDGPTLARGRNLIMAGNHILDYCLTRPHLVKPAFLNRLAHVYIILGFQNHANLQGTASPFISMFYHTHPIPPPIRIIFVCNFLHGPFLRPYNFTPKNV